MTTTEPPLRYCVCGHLEREHADEQTSHHAERNTRCCGKVGLERCPCLGFRESSYSRSARMHRPGELS
jgi:hypothetical protein